MHIKMLFLIFALAVSGCKTTGEHVKLPVECPKIPEAPAWLMQEPQLEKEIESIFWEEDDTTMSGSEDYNDISGP